MTCGNSFVVDRSARGSSSVVSRTTRYSVAPLTASGSAASPVEVVLRFQSDDRERALAFGRKLGGVTWQFGLSQANHRLAAKSNCGAIDLFDGVFGRGGVSFVRMGEVVRALQKRGYAVQSLHRSPLWVRGWKDYSVEPPTVIEIVCARSVDPAVAAYLRSEEILEALQDEVVANFRYQWEAGTSRIVCESRIPNEAEVDTTPLRDLTLPTLIDEGWRLAVRPGPVLRLR